jgi:pimeloyl-ACP methyl ester carboxylesterase
LHGGGIDTASLSWKFTIEPLANHLRVFAPDWPGYGASDKPGIQYTTDDYIGFLSDFMQTLGIVDTSLVGISMGGGIALGFALQYPQRVSKLVLVDSYGLQTAAPAHKLSYLFTRIPLMNDLTWYLLKHSRTMTLASLQYIFHNPNAVSDELVDEVHAELKKSGDGRAFISFQKSEVLWNGLRTVYVDRLHEIKAPTLIVHGAQDTLVPLDCARLAHELIRGSRLHVIADCGHWPQREKPEEFHRVLVGFLTQRGDESADAA